MTHVDDEFEYVILKLNQNYRNSINLMLLLILILQKKCINMQNGKKKTIKHIFRRMLTSDIRQLYLPLRVLRQYFDTKNLKTARNLSVFMLNIHFNLHKLKFKSIQQEYKPDIYPVVRRIVIYDIVICHLTIQASIYVKQ